ncbi:hypothetical protein CBM2592_P260003 [Cupriavidus taiwanensis]|uniref:Uncharacterized protein n=1 Tax=Cupriavidus taiwanensis TaxID=164546 RepID=A0A375CQV8_9BURK|nr:hypothetical protein CBM2592_P260003 [Cupriavidus taiwanensis]SOY77815.1 hypothetical protein CBM2586_P230003 [Cupriavidus taiwanensis]SOZ75853.1 hypothetical protein CBM2617_P240003 [Cupriavidus taiwanensis]
MGSQRLLAIVEAIGGGPVCLATRGDSGYADGRTVALAAPGNRHRGDAPAPAPRIEVAPFVWTEIRSF